MKYKLARRVMCDVCEYFVYVSAVLVVHMQHTDES